MANTYTYQVTSLDHRTSDGKVICIHYSITADNGAGVTARYNGMVGTNGDVTIPYEELTEEIVIGWVKDGLALSENVTTTYEENEEVVDEEGTTCMQAVTKERSEAECFTIAENRILTDLDRQISEQITPVRTYGVPW
tara:strand:+ start:187 stop:600 length:414 start_codon:yes stop_codon:yes gene_type:complete